MDYTTVITIHMYYHRKQDWVTIPPDNYFIKLTISGNSIIHKYIPQQYIQYGRQYNNMYYIYWTVCRFIT